MKKLVFLILFVSSPSFAVQSLDCDFADGEYTLKAKLNADQSLKVTEVAGEPVVNGPSDESAINNNPVKREVARDGRSKYSIDALDSDPDYGNLYVLYLPKKVKVGSNPASLSYTYVSREAGTPDYVQGTCTLK